MDNHGQQADTDTRNAELGPSTPLLDDAVERHSAVSSCQLSNMEKALLGEDVIACGGCLNSRGSNFDCTKSAAATKVLYRGEGVGFCQGRPAERDLAILILKHQIGLDGDDPKGPLPRRCLFNCPRSEILVPNEFVERLASRSLSYQEKSDEEYCLDLMCDMEEEENLTGILVGILDFAELAKDLHLRSGRPPGKNVNATELEEMVSRWGFPDVGIKFRGECLLVLAKQAPINAAQVPGPPIRLLLETMGAILAMLQGICESCIDSWLETREHCCGGSWTDTMTQVVPNWEKHSPLNYDEELPLVITHGSVLTILWILTHHLEGIFFPPIENGLGLLGRALALAREDTGATALEASGYLRFPPEEIFDGLESSCLSVRNGSKNFLLLGRELQLAVNRATSHLYKSAEGSDLVATEQGLTSRRLRRKKVGMLAALVCVSILSFALAAIITANGVNLSGIMATLAGTVTTLSTAWLFSNSDVRRWLCKGARVSRADMTDADKAKCIILANSSRTASKIFDGKKLGPTGLLYSGSLDPGRRVTAEELTAMGYVRIRGSKILYNWITEDWRRISFENSPAHLDPTRELVGTFEVEPLRCDYSIQ